MQRAGDLVGVGSHGEVQRLGYHWELQMLEMAACSLRRSCSQRRAMARESSASSRTWEHYNGGKLADLVVLRANPPEGIANASAIEYVMRNGVLYEGDTLSVVGR